MRNILGLKWGNKKRFFLTWLPRILSIIYILFLSLFALDVFGEGYSFVETIIALFMHLIPNFGLILLLIIAWRKEFLGGILYFLLAILFTFLFKTYREIPILLFISGPPLLIGILFMADFFLKNKQKQ